MNWREWPQGAEYAGDTEPIPGANDCPVCHTSLRPMEIYYTSTYENVIYYTAICPHCRTRYERNAPAGTVTISPDAESITELEERVRILETTLSRLITFIRTQQQITGTHTQQKSLTENDTSEEFTRKYRYLL